MRGARASYRRIAEPDQGQSLLLEAMASAGDRGQARGWDVVVIKAADRDAMVQC